MVCKKCGKEIPEGTKFCTGCGEPVEAAAAPTVTPVVTPAAAPAGEAAGSKNPMKAIPDDKKKLIFAAGGAVVALVVLILFCSLIFGDSPKKTFKAFVTGTFSCDAKKVWDNSIYAKKAQKALDIYDEDDYEDDYQDAKDDAQDQKEDWKDDGIKYKVKIDISKVEKIKKKDREFEWAQELMEDYYDCSAGKVKEFAIVEAKVKAEYYEDGDRDKDYDEGGDRTQYLLVKIGGNWYMTYFSRDNIKSYLKDYYK